MRTYAPRQTYPSKMTKDERRAYQTQRNNAALRNIAWHFTPETWLRLWVESGHLLNRGCKKGQYVMSRIGDSGPYSEDNVHICTTEENITYFHTVYRRENGVNTFGRGSDLPPGEMSHGTTL